MDQSRDNRIMALVHACSEMNEAARSSFLDVQCDGDQGLKREVEELIAEGTNKTSSQVIHSHLAGLLPPYYRLLGLLGTGGMSEVFLAEDTRLDRRVAIKFLNDTFRHEPERMKRFNQEARSASALNHPNIITIHDLGENDGVQYIVSEFVEGETLGTRLVRGRLPIDEALDIAIQIASALSAAHKAGIIHRDLKPDNIMLRRDGTVKVVDFGIAKASAIYGVLDDQSATAVSTSPGLILGTPRYMSPEQTRGTPLDARTDIFSLGIVMFEMVTGHSPFGGSNAADVIAGIVGQEPRSMADYIDPPPQLTHIVHKALAKDRNERYQSASDLLADLRGLRSELSTPSRAIRPGPERRSWVWIAGAIALLALIGGIWFIVGVRPVANTSSAAAMRSVPITSWSSVSAESVSSASFSPNARMVAFASTKSGPSEIWVKQTTGGDPVQVTKNGFYNQYPVWSPDDQEIAYFSSRGDNRGIWKVAFTGGQESQVLSGLTQARLLRWTTDKRLFFQDGSDMPEIFVLDLNSNQSTKLTDLVGTGTKARAIAVSPDGSSFAISVNEAGMWKVKTRRFDSSTFTEIASSKDQIDKIAFHPNGRELFYTGGVDGILQIFSAGAGAPPLQMSSGNNDLSLEDVSSDGSKILYNTISETSDLWALNLADGKESVVANDTSEEYWPDVSADGKSVVYQAVAQADRPFRGSILVKTLGSDTVVQISADGFCPVWSPNSEWIAFLRRTPSEIGVWKVRANGADATRIYGGAVGTPGYTSVPYLKNMLDPIVWTPDGTSLAFSAKVDGVGNLWVSSVNDGGSRVLTSNKETAESFCCAAWSPDNTGLAFISDTISGPTKVHRLWLSMPDGSGAHVIFESKVPLRLLGWAAGELVIAQSSGSQAAPTVVDTFAIMSQTGAKREIATVPNAYFYNFHLSNNGQTVAYTTRSNGLSEIWSFATSGGPPRRIAAQNDPKILVSSLTWAPDGKSLVYGRQTRTNVLSMLSN
jgi:serine/threonine protein kinase